MRYKFYNYLTVGLIGLLTLSCNKAKENIDIQINADIIHYSVLLEVSEPSGTTPVGLSMSVTGSDAGAIYDIVGNRNLQLSNGLITLGVSPKNEPTGGNPVNFSVKISGPGYASVTVPVIIDKGQFNQVKTVRILKLSSLPLYVTAVDKIMPLGGNGTPAQPITISSPKNAVSQEVTTVTVPANTQFLDAAGTQITGNSVDLNIVNYNTQLAGSSSLFPGGTFSATNVTDSNNQTISAFFFPAAFATVTLKVNNIDIKKFSQPITISLELNPLYKTLNSNTTVKNGDQLPIWSYSKDTGKWSYEKDGTVNTINGKLVVQFTTSHLTTYSVAEYVETTTCRKPSIVFNADWLKTGTQPLTLEIWNKDESKLLSTQTVIVSNGLEYILNELPSLEVKYKILTNTGDQLATGSIINPCSGGKVNVTLSAPSIPVVGITLSLIVKCPDKGVITPPDFYLYYRISGATTGYKLLGVVKKGKLSTTLLAIGQHFDFKVQWGNDEKIIKNYLIDKDNLSTTFGLDDHIGNVSPNKNRAILIEECSKI